jgi:hypothetical protein
MQTVSDRPEITLSPETPSRGAQMVDRVRRRWAGMAGQIGLFLAIAGFVAIFFGWNGAAGQNREPAQIPYLISGGAIGLGLVVLGAALIVSESHRRDRAVLERQLQELNDSIGRLASATSAVVGNGHSTTQSAASSGGRRRAQPQQQQQQRMVVAGRTSFHEPSCHLIEGRTDGIRMTRDDAVAEGLSPCRVCSP